MDAEARIQLAASPHDLAAVARLFRDYQASLDIDLAYQDFDGELTSLPGRYAPPKGALFVAHSDDGTAIGCVALRARDHGAEIKRLYVAPAARGTGLGRALMTAIVAEAARIGHREIRLDTLPSMAAAQALYRAAGFRPIAPYYDGAVPGTLFFGLILLRDASAATQDQRE